MQIELAEEAKFIKDVFNTMKFKSWSLCDNEVILSTITVNIRYT